MHLTIGKVNGKSAVTQEFRSKFGQFPPRSCTREYVNYNRFTLAKPPKATGYTFRRYRPSMKVIRLLNIIRFGAKTHLPRLILKNQQAAIKPGIDQCGKRIVVIADLQAYYRLSAVIYRSYYLSIRH